MLLHALGLSLLVALGGLAVADGASAQALTPGDIYVSDPNAFGGAGGIIKINPISGAQTAVSQGGLFVDPVYLAISASGELYVVDSASQGSGAVIRVNPTTGAQTLVSSGGLLDGPAGIAIGANGDLFVTNGLCGCNPPDILRINPTSGAQSVLTSGDRLLFPLGITVAENGDLIVANANVIPGVGASVLRVNSATGAQSLVTSGNLLVQPSDVAIAGNGDILVADPAASDDDGAIIRVNPGTGAQSIVSEDNLFADPVGLALALTGDILVVDGGCGCAAASVLRVNPTSGAQTVLSTANLLVSPTGIAVVPAAPATRTPTATVTGTGTTTLTATVTVTGTLPASNTPSSTPSATGTSTPTATPSATATATGTPGVSATPSPSVTLSPSATPFVGQLRHAFLIPTGRSSGLLAQGPVEPGPCPRLLNNCMRFQVTGSFTVRGQLGELPAGLAPVLTVPVVPQSGTPPSTRTVNCQPATSSGAASCDGAVAEPGIQPQVGGTVVANGALANPTASATPTATVSTTPTGTPVASLTPTPAVAGSPTPPLTSTPGSGAGATFHALFQNGSASATVLPGPCPLGQPGCVQFTVTGGFLVSGSLAGLTPGGIPTLLIPVTTGSGAPAGTRSLICAAADAMGTAQCSGVVSDPGIIPAAGTVATYTVSGGATPLATPGGAAVVVIPAPPPLLPPLPPPPLLAPPLAPPGLPPGGIRPVPEEVPLIPETESLWLILAGIAVAAGIGFLRRR